MGNYTEVAESKPEDMKSLNFDEQKKLLMLETNIRKFE